MSSDVVLCCLHLRHKQLAAVQLRLTGFYPAVVLCDVELQLFAAVDQRFNLRFHLADVETSCGEFVLHHVARLCHLKRRRSNHYFIN